MTGRVAATVAERGAPRRTLSSPTMHPGATVPTWRSPSPSSRMTYASPVVTSRNLLTSCTPVRIQKARVYANRARTVWSDDRDPSRPTQGPAARPAGVVTAAQKASRIAFHIVGKT